MKSFTSLLALAASASAHTIFQEFYVNGVSQGHQAGIREVSYDGPITDVTSNDIICNGAVNTLVQPYPPPKVITVAAGSSVTTEWHHTLAGYDATDIADPIDASHLGPVIVYMAKVPSATQTTVTGLQWFKIYQDGLHSDGTWAVNTLITNKGKVNFKIPSCIPAGQYLLRAEIIALHAASSYPGAQFYMECAQLQVTGGGSANPATVSFPGAYKGTDPGITFNVSRIRGPQNNLIGTDVCSFTIPSQPHTPFQDLPSSHVDPSQTEKSTSVHTLPSTYTFLYISESIHIIQRHIYPSFCAHLCALRSFFDLNLASSFTAGPVPHCARQLCSSSSVHNLGRTAKTK